MFGYPAILAAALLLALANVPALEGRDHDVQERQVHEDALQCTGGRGVFLPYTTARVFQRGLAYLIRPSLHAQARVVTGVPLGQINTFPHLIDVVVDVMESGEISLAYAVPGEDGSTSGFLTSLPASCIEFLSHASDETDASPTGSTSFTVETIWGPVSSESVYLLGDQETFRQRGIEYVTSDDAGQFVTWNPQQPVDFTTPPGTP